MEMGRLKQPRRDAKMQAKDAIRHTLQSSERMMLKYLEDLNDEDLLLRPVEGMNPIAWQVGHLVASERMMMEQIKPGASPPLDEGFLTLHARDATKPKPEEGWLKKDEYIKLFKTQRQATLSMLEQATDKELDAPSPERMQMMAPTFGAIFNMAGVHILMHLGQFVAVRRKLGKPIAM
jgi:uncharacterized damage-inducible protein DinB